MHARPRGFVSAPLRDLLMGRSLCGGLVAGCLLWLPACSRCDERPPPTVPSPAQGPLSDAPEGSQTAPSSPTTCRALISLASEKGYHVVDLSLGPRPSAKMGDGLVVRDGKKTFALQTVSEHREGSNKFGNGTADWNKLLIATIPGGTPSVFMEHPVELSLPEDEDSGSDHDANDLARVTAIVGPYVSIDESTWGYTGGAHGFEGSTQQIVRLPDPASVAARVLGTAAKAHVQREIDAANAAREKDEPGIEPIPMADLSGFAMTVWKGGKGGLRIHSSVDCCSWVENHNHHELDLELTSIPEALAPHLSFSADEKRLIQAPDGCGAVGLEANQLVVRVGTEGKTEVVALALPPLSDDALLGVAFIPASDPFDLSQLPKWDGKVQRPEVQKLSQRDLGSYDYRLPADSVLAHPLFRAPLGASQSAVLALVKKGDRLEGIVFSEEEYTKQWALPSLQDQGKLEEVSAIMFDNLDDDAAREPVIMTRLTSAAEKPVQHNVVLDWNGSAFVRLPALEQKIQDLTTAKQIRAALK